MTPWSSSDYKAVEESRELRRAQAAVAQKEYNIAVLETKLKELEQRNHQLMRVICKIDGALASNTEWQQHLLNGDAEVRSVIQDHRLLDEQRWYSMYSTEYPKFSKEEIAKMVRSGILED